MLWVKPIWVLRFAAVWVVAHIVIVPAQIFFHLWWQAALGAVVTVLVGIMVWNRRRYLFGKNDY